MLRGIDHLVLCVNDLKKARLVYETLGFTMTPVAQHPFGTGNTLVQMDGCFLELLAVTQPGDITEAKGEHFSFAAFNRDFLKSRQGMSMLVLDSTDEIADRAEFMAKGLHVYAPFDFQRLAKQPDGSEHTVGFSLTFVGDERLRDMAFFTCKQWRPDLFWKPDYRRHANGALRIDEVFVIAPDPAQGADFLAAFADSAIKDAGNGVVKVSTARGTLGLYTPAAFNMRFPNAWPQPLGSGPCFAGFSLDVADMQTAEAQWHSAAIPFHRTGDVCWLHPDQGLGCVIALKS
jgi:hypothetical protein